MLNTPCARLWREDEGVLTFEWILLITVIVIGIVGGLSGVRDAIIDELGDVAGAAVSIDQSYTVTASACPAGNPLGNEFQFVDQQPNLTAPCDPAQTNVVKSRSTQLFPGQFSNGGCLGGP